MFNYNNLPDRIDIDRNGNVYVQKIPGLDRMRLMCACRGDKFITCNVMCAKCAFYIEETETKPIGPSFQPEELPKSYWVVSCCGVKHKAKHLYQQRHVDSVEPQYYEVAPQYE